MLSITIAGSLPKPGWLADPNGFLVQRLNADSGRVALALGKNSYAYLTR